MTSGSRRGPATSPEGEAETLQATVCRPRDVLPLSCCVAAAAHRRDVRDAPAGRRPGARCRPALPGRRGRDGRRGGSRGAPPAGPCGCASSAGHVLAVPLAGCCSCRSAPAPPLGRTSIASTRTGARSLHRLRTRWSARPTSRSPTTRRAIAAFRAEQEPTGLPCPPDDADVLVGEPRPKRPHAGRRRRRARCHPDVLAISSTGFGQTAPMRRPRTPTTSTRGPLRLRHPQRGGRAGRSTRLGRPRVGGLRGRHIVAAWAVGPAATGIGLDYAMG
jgi:hypothetical protein